MASSDFSQGFAAGWLAASQAILNAMGRRPTPLEMAGDKPGRRRGRPPKAASSAPVTKRPRGRPRKNT